MDSSPPVSSIHRILQARILEWAAISFSSGHAEVVVYHNHEGCPWEARDLIPTQSFLGWACSGKIKLHNTDFKNQQNLHLEEQEDLQDSTLEGIAHEHHSKLKPKSYTTYPKHKFFKNANIPLKKIIKLQGNRIRG